MDSLTQIHLLYKQFFAWACNSCSTVLLTDHMNNLVYQALIGKDQYDSASSNERVYRHLRASSGYTKEPKKLERINSKINVGIMLKAPATKKLRLSIWAHSLVEYLYVLSRQHLTLRHKTSSISQQRHDLLE